MVKINGLVKPYTRIFLGVVYFIIAIIYIADKLINSLDIRLFDWIGWIALFAAGATSIIEGISLKNKLE